MKTLKKIVLPVIIFSSFIIACTNDEFESITGVWAPETKVYLNTIGEKSLFFADNQGYFLVDSMEFRLTLNSNGIENFNPVYVEIYAYVIEEINGEIIQHGGTEGKLLTTVDISNSSDFIFKLEEVNRLYGAELSTQTVNPEDQVVLKYLIIDKSGETYDMRFDCYGAHCQYFVPIERGIVCENNFEGTYHYEVIKLGGDNADGVVGDTGTIHIERLAYNGKYWVDDIKCGTGFLGNRQAGEMHEADCNNIITFPYDGYETIWEFDNFNGPTVDIIISEYWWDWYLDWGIGYYYTVVRLTRTDGLDWPIVKSDKIRALGLPGGY